MKKLIYALVASLLLLQTIGLNTTIKAEVAPPEAWGALPSESQKAYHEEELAAFIHFGVNTFTNSEWGNGKENPNVFNPSELDTDQWVKTLKDAGFKRIIMIGRHHDGFCLWKSAHTEHDVDNSIAWQEQQKQQGKDGDVLLSVSKSCTKYDIDMGLYLSPWDANNASYGYGNGLDDASDTNGDYNEYYMNQLEEVLGNPAYGNNGKFVEVWMDGAKGTGAAAQRYKFQEWFDLIEKLQPGALVFSPYGSSIRWVGNESGIAGDPCWSKIKKAHMQNEYDSGKETASILNSGMFDGDIWSIAEADVSLTSGWFWHNGNQPKSMEQLTNIYFKSVGRGQPLLLNVAPDNRGKFTDADMQRVSEFGNAIKNTFARDITKAEGVSASASSIRGDDSAYAATQVLDDNKDTYWTMNDNQMTGSLTIDLNGYKYFDVVSIEEYISLGQRISDFNVEVHTEYGWKKFDDGHTIGAKRLARNAPVTADQIRINITGAHAVPLIANVGVFKADKAFEKEKLIPDEITKVDSVDLDNNKSWIHESQGDDNTSMYSTTKGTYASTTFTGSKAWIYGTTDPGHGIMEVWIDNVKVADVDTYRSNRTLPALLYETDNLTYGEHTIKMVVSGNKHASASGTAVGIDFVGYLDQPGGMFEIEQTNYVAQEGSIQEIVIKRKGGSVGEASVHFSTLPNTAVHGRHYKDVNETITFADGQERATVLVEIIDNEEVTGELDFICQLDTPTGAIIGANRSAIIAIQDDDQMVSMDEVLTQASSKKKAYFTTSSWRVFEEANADALTVNENATATELEIKTAIKNLMKAMDQLVTRNAFSQEDPALLPSKIGNSALWEAEFFTLDPLSNDKYVRVEEQSGASNGKMVTWFETGNKIKLPYDAKYSGTYTMTVTYCSGRTEANPNSMNWSGEHVIAGSVDVFGPDANVPKTVSFDVEITKPGSGELIFTANESASPNIDKFEVMPKKLNDSELMEIIAEAKSIQSDQYTSVSYAQLMEAIVEVEAVVADEYATADDVANSISLLSMNKAKLVSIELLKDAVNNAQAKYNQNYTQASIDALKIIVEEVKLLYVDGNDVTIAAKIVKIQNSIDALLELGDKTALKELISSAEKIEGNYTLASKKLLMDTLNEAKKVVANQDVSKVEVEKAVRALNKAIEGLEKVSDDITTDESEENKPQTPDTSDTSEGDAYLALLLMAVGVMMIKSKTNRV